MMKFLIKFLKSENNLDFSLFLNSFFLIYKYYLNLLYNMLSFAKLNKDLRPIVYVTCGEKKDAVI
jgi:hypothetical protein